MNIEATVEELFHSNSQLPVSELTAKMGKELTAAAGAMGASGLSDDEGRKRATRWLHKHAPIVCETIRANPLLKILTTQTPELVTATALVSLTKDILEGLPPDPTRSAVHIIGIAFASLLILREGYAWFEQTFTRNN